MPKDVAHGFSNLGSRSGTVLCIETHPGPLESFFDEVGETATDDSSPLVRVMAMDDLLAAAERTGGLEIVSRLPEGHGSVPAAGEV